MNAKNFYQNPHNPIIVKYAISEYHSNQMLLTSRFKSSSALYLWWFHNEIVYIIIYRTR